MFIKLHDFVFNFIPKECSINDQRKLVFFSIRKIHKQLGLRTKNVMFIKIGSDMNDTRNDPYVPSVELKNVFITVPLSKDRGCAIRAQGFHTDFSICPPSQTSIPISSNFFFLHIALTTVIELKNIYAYVWNNKEHTPRCGPHIMIIIKIFYLEKRLFIQIFDIII